jgi:hypothetical protein
MYRNTPMGQQTLLEYIGECRCGGMGFGSQNEQISPLG